VAKQQKERPVASGSQSAALEIEKKRLEQKKKMLSTAQYASELEDVNDFLKME